MTPSAIKVATCTLSKIGCGKREVVAFWGHGIQNGISTWMVSWLGEGFLKKPLIKAAKKLMIREQKFKKAQWMNCL